MSTSSYERAVLRLLEQIEKNTRPRTSSVPDDEDEPGYDGIDPIKD